ncbi:chemotaxis protein CheA [Celerinatantimonas diazotrophica]|uniref:Chemotaxis protein CheA n=1 Tax=Celerinatantimonas diazotrophica TaxID=412034 RepID=A0A4R1JM10_9GAMM|nr:chemotaxis protein CheA [Celerinatantimonas diazotrophica]TCK52115.1 two-component system chemotaxis sensor kinase CheA [Celerinatantimonas diazotrophica]CAG9296180.1 Chemotaxis protein CheA [Celerinatantimonas diazotrophica]
MSFDVDEEILQDFLIEASEILEQLSEQLVELENSPDDRDLLNAIFRGFHTVKGGAGFLSLHELVDACHGAENVFDNLRNGGRAVTSELMDVILEALDAINDMFASVQAREQPAPASPEILEKLHQLSQPAGAEPEPEPEPEESASEPEVVQEPESAQESSSVDDITDDEFEQLLDELHGASAHKATDKSIPKSDETPKVTVSSNSDSDEITDEEFERLLDELHGSGGQSISKSADTKAPAASTGNGDEINDDEFEKLLDELHGSGKAPGDSVQVSQTKSVPSAAKPSKPQTPPPSAKKAAAPAKQPASTSGHASAKPAEVKAEQAKEHPQKAAAHPQGETTVRVDTRTLDDIMNMVGELVLVRNRLVSLGLNSNDEEVSKATSNLDVVTADLQGAVMKTRMQPIKKVFGRFPRVVRDLARSLKKDINLVMVGEETDLDKNLVEALADPLVHLVRNSVDHGIEMPDVREAAGKPRTGVITLSASQEGDHILLQIADDGAGMDPEKLKSIAIERGVMDADAAARMSDNEAYNLIFAPGFSTKKEISDISGRGVGMDVVKTGITKLNGQIDIDSHQGVGTTLRIKVPLTLAILPTLMVSVGEQIFALPLTSVNEIFHLDLTKTNVVDGQETVIVRDKPIPLFYLQSWLIRNHPKGSKPKDGHVVVVQVNTLQVGFVVDSLIGQEEVVIKALDQLLHGTPGMAGATITSDGRIALILDIPSLLKRYARRM